MWVCVPVDPVGDVEGAIGAESEKVVRGDGFRLACSLQHEELWKDRNGFQIDTEGPHDFEKGEFVIKDEGEYCTWPEEVFELDGVDGGIMCWPKPHSHEVEDIERRRDEEELHHDTIQ